MFGKILIANRGEIACRVIKTLSRLGIASVAVYSEADASARHVALADEAWPIGAAAAADSYLRGDRILQVARRSGAEAIHPGYGFLSENADFADACAKAGVVFIGPPPSAIRAMGSKSAAKALMQAAGVPLVPGYHGADQTPTLLAEQAARIGFPVLIKASAGGGGKGMRVVNTAGEFHAALAGAKREASASFGDDHVLIERYLSAPRHIEIQVFADSHGNFVHLFERDCSIQRRHQKVLEEAPAPGMSYPRREAMGQAAIAAARAVGYVGAGTVEFIAEGDDFHFMEMNTRLQVEHPVTEMITGQELVEWQIRVAAGEPLPRLQDELRIHGHAIEARIYAEDPAEDFRPSTGRLLHLVSPPASLEVRIDTGVRAGDEITPFYDPMIAKLIVHGEDRADALAHLRTALAQYEVVGVQTNLAMLRAIAAEPDFATAKLDTGFIARHAHVLNRPAAADAKTILAAAALAVLRDQRSAAEASVQRSGDPWSPWAAMDSWRMNIEGWHELHLRIDGRMAALRACPEAAGRYRLLIDDSTVSAVEEAADVVRLDGVVRRLPVIRRGDTFTVLCDGRPQVVFLVDPYAPPSQESAGEDRVVALTPGRLVRVMVSLGQVVTRGTPLAVIEAMKMEMTLKAPRDGVVESVRFAEGDLISEGAELVVLAKAPGTTPH